MSATAMPAPRPPLTRVWTRAVRIFSFTASITPVLVGSAFAVVDRKFEPLLFLPILLACVLVHAGCNLANDYFDFSKGTDRENVLGPSGVIQDGWLTANQVRFGMIACFAIATVLGLVVLAVSTWWLLLLAITSLLAAVLYTGGPKPLGYVALGEATVFLFMGIGIICGTYVAMTEQLTWEVAIGSLSVSCLVAAILHANNIRDTEVDARAGKTTLAQLLGPRCARTEFTALIVASYASVALLIVLWPSNWPTAIVLATAPLALYVSGIVRRSTTVADLNASVRLTAQLHFRFGLLLTGGLLIRAALDRLV
jgi:1,4-dihydroxy-2-naphthoate octaprenyltransferase